LIALQWYGVYPNVPPAIEGRGFVVIQVDLGEVVESVAFEDCWGRNAVANDRWLNAQKLKRWREIVAAARQQRKRETNAATWQSPDPSGPRHAAGRTEASALLKRKRRAHFQS